MKFLRRQVAWIAPGALIFFAATQVACSPLLNQGTPEEYAVRRTSPNSEARLQRATPIQFNHSLELSRANLVAGFSFLEPPFLGDRPTRIALRFWPLETRAGHSFAPPHLLLRVDVKPPSGRCDGCFVRTEQLLAQDGEGGAYYVLPEVSFFEAGTWTFRVTLTETGTARVVDEVRDQITIH